MLHSIYPAMEPLPKRTLFIKMYIKNIDATVKFHAKFAESNNLLLANSIANKIEDTQIRENTLSEISKSIIMRKENVRE